MSAPGGARREEARAKVNLFLHVTGRRADGYHLLDSLAVFPPVGDVVTAEAASGLSLALTGPFGAALANEADNLVLRAARRLAADRGVTSGARLTLEKRLPVASGIGGGSADAAAALRALSLLWGVTPADTAMAASMGADVPVCLASRPARMGGVGEALGPAPVLPRFWMVLVNPGVAVATPAVFRARDGGFTPAATLPERWSDSSSMAAALGALRNDLEPPAVALCPPIAEALAWLRAVPGCMLARMSGSGATCFGVFAAVPPLPRPPAGWWAWSGEHGAENGVGSQRD